MSSGFETEKEIEEKKRLRQAEWDKVRKPEDPIEAPLPPEKLTDRRSLYEQLQDQKLKKQEEYEEAHKLKNLVRGIDDDEADFLEFCDKAKLDEERRKRLEESKEIIEFRNKVAEIREKEMDILIKQEIGLIKPKKPLTTSTTDEELPSIGVKKTSQTKLLSGLVKRKSGDGTVHNSKIDAKIPRQNEAEGCTSALRTATDEPTIKKSPENVGNKQDEIPSVPYKGNLVCIGVLPGLSSYGNSSSDESGDDSSSNSEKLSPPHVLRDLCGRRVVDSQQEETKEKKK